MTKQSLRSRDSYAHSAAISMSNGGSLTNVQQDQLTERETAYYQAWMSYGGETRVQDWSKRRAMFWGLLLEQERTAAYAVGRQIGAQLGQPDTAPHCNDLRLQWFLSKAVVASLFDVRSSGNHYTLQPRDADPWAKLLVQFSQSMASGQLDPRLPVDLPARAPLSVADDATLLEIACSFFGTDATVVFGDVLRADDQNAREIRYALTRGDPAAARHWYEREWSFRAKNVHRALIIQEQGGVCACCGHPSRRLELNHRQKVRAWGRSTRENLQALCPLCHRFTDKQGRPCHVSPLAAREHG